jgi:predicted enzyme related to lactoylglutathione lyase
MADDVPRATAFYGEVVGWSVREQDMGPMGTYHIFSSGGADRAGLMARPSDAPHGPMWTHYVMVPDLNAAFERAGELGGMQFVPPTPIPGHGRFALIADPQGAVIGLFGT